MKILVTGGAGYIGSTICSALEDKGHTPIILDSLISGRVEFTKNRIFYKGDIADEALLETIFKEHNDIVFTIHCAALMGISKSVEYPFEYYTENISKSIKLFKKLNELGCNKIIFSSCSTMYDDDVETFMVTEKSPLKPKTPYSRTKYMTEMVLEDFCKAYNMKGISLRYFNLIGADPKMRSGMYSSNESTILGKLVNVYKGRQENFKITGVNWATRDGSGIRDYIDIWDLANAHVLAVENFEKAFEKCGSDTPYLTINLGTGEGVTVKELVNSFEKVTGTILNKVETEPRLGDIGGAYANIDLAKKMLNWVPEVSVDESILNALKWDEVRVQTLKY
ncbi:UDP-glucose 4-epimerase GalE [Inconstantimicrobium mannanitabidum]|uniref:UDP-glucose 4-epimerase GalE n=1 Tax=Inconstantimicrobium mannanitabidum TaxID=1604901 RepID=A0ACB5RH44_9CLOT|nr:UDP-glucose 4-epimerase GalE [Clostridium sp. TW13]GKX68397.1 UDP-glucose 4-epimerase GalE [Clostridium sp. TW13]